MRKILFPLFLTVAMVGALLAGCGIKQEAADQTIGSAVAENTVTPEMTPTEEPAVTATSTPVPTEGAVETPTEVPTAEPTVTQAVEPTATPTVVPTSTPEPTVTPEPTETPVPTATPTVTPVPTSTPTPTPTSTPTPTVTPLPTATPTPTATPLPTATSTPMPTPLVSQIKATYTEKLQFNEYTCGEKGEEVLELVKSLREENPNLSRSRLVELLSTEYEYSEQDVMYGVYNSGWKEFCLEIVKNRVENGTQSKMGLLKYLGKNYPFIEEDLVYAVENCEADWNEQAVKSLENSLYGPKSSGKSYKDCVEAMKNACFTDEEIEYALEMLKPDWQEQAVKKAKTYTEKAQGGGISYLGLIDRLVESHSFDEAMATRAAESIKNDVNWNEQAVKSMKWFMKGGHSRERLIEILQDKKFTDEQIEYALEVVNP